MGSISSKDNGNDSAMSTPPRSGIPQRILEFDPRSPSTEITRTPILVEKTPEGMLDPRSPTPGILRTPINTLDGHVPHDRVPLMPSLLLEDSGEKDPEEELEDTDKLLQDFDNLQQMSLTDKQTYSQNDSIHLIYHDEDTIVRRGNAKPPQPKQLFQGNKKLGTNVKDITRSPLSTRNVDVNSPRNIVQRKQTKKVENAKSCMHEAVINNKIILHNKENVEF